MVTGKKDASAASKQLKNKKSTADEKSVAGSDLAQAKKAGAKKEKVALAAHNVQFSRLGPDGNE